MQPHHNVTETEWMLNNTLLSNALSKLNFTPEIDLYFQFPLYVAYQPDPGAEAMDALTSAWFELKFYTFPPFSIIAPVQKKRKEDKATGVCILLHWPTQAWFPMVEKWRSAKTSCFHPADPYYISRPSLYTYASLSLLVCLLSGNN